MTKHDIIGTLSWAAPEMLINSRVNEKVPGQNVCTCTGQASSSLAAFGSLAGFVAVERLLSQSRDCFRSREIAFAVKRLLLPSRDCSPPLMMDRAIS